MGRVRTGAVKVQGLSDLNKALKAIGPDARKELKDVSKEASDMVASDARRIAYTIGGVAAKVAPSIRATASVTGSGAVSIGGAAYPMAGGAEFGSLKYKQFKPWRGNGPDAGYFLYPAIRDDIDKIVELYVEGIDGIIKRRFPE